MPSGPRDRQIKQQLENQLRSDNSGLIDELRSQIAELKRQLSDAPKGGYTVDQVNEEIEKAIKAELSEIRAKLEIKEHNIRGLNKEIARLESELVEKNKTIKELRNQKPVTDNNVTALLAEATKKIEALSTQVLNSTGQEAIIDPDRPQMEAVFVDPIERDSKVEKHFDVEKEDKTNKKEEMAGKVDKLKNLLGKLPSKR
jgi:DNA repair exonuclease SbcCD ATPase subunit